MAIQQAVQPMQETIFEENPATRAMREFLSSMANNPEQKFLLENMRRVVATAKRDYNKCVRVKDGVINVRNESMLLRMVPHIPIPDGFYYLTLEATKTQLNRYTMAGYHDLDALIPTGEELNASGPVMMVRAQCNDFCTWLNFVKDNQGTVTLTRQGAYMQRDPKVFFPFTLNLLEREEMQDLSPSLLVMTFIEAQRYEHVFVSRPRSDDLDLPIVVGVSPSRCAIVTSRPWRTVDAGLL